MDKLQALYDSEINFKISCFWDGGFEGWVGDGYDDKWKVSLTADTFSQIVDAIWEAAKEIYPDAKVFRPKPSQP